VNRLPSWRFLHPTDFSEASEVAFIHALKLALVTRGQLHVLHVETSDAREPWARFPGVRQTLERWGALPADSPPTAVGHLGIDVEKIAARRGDPVSATADYLRREPADVIVLATHRRDGFARWRRPSVAQAIAQHVGEVALFVPAGIDGFVSAATGEIRIRRVLVPLARRPVPQPAVDAAAALASAAGSGPVTFRLVHAGADGVPRVTTPDEARWTWERHELAGEPATAILRVMDGWCPDLAVMSTEGRHGFMDAVRGSTTEQVLRGATCPVLAVSMTARSLPRLSPPGGPAGTR
jgi:nucleotide-binding universal stress UspA family protein